MSPSCVHVFLLLLSGSLTRNSLCSADSYKTPPVPSGVHCGHGREDVCHMLGKLDESVNVTTGNLNTWKEHLHFVQDFHKNWENKFEEVARDILQNSALDDNRRLRSEVTSMQTKLGALESATSKLRSDLEIEKLARRETEASIARLQSAALKTADVISRIAPSEMTDDIKEELSFELNTSGVLEHENNRPTPFENITIESLNSNALVEMSSKLDHLESNMKILNETIGVAMSNIKILQKNICSVPSDPMNGRVRYSSLKYGTELKYNCNKGYILKEHQPRICSEDGTWSNDVPKCEEIICSVPPDPMNGRVRYSSLKYGTELEYECNDGYMLKEHNPRICSEDGTWSNDEPECNKRQKVPQMTKLPRFNLGTSGRARLRRGNDVGLVPRQNAWR